MELGTHDCNQWWTSHQLSLMKKKEPWICNVCSFRFHRGQLQSTNLLTTSFWSTKYLTNGSQEPFQVRVGSSIPILHLVLPWWRQIWPLSYVFSTRLYNAKDSIWVYHALVAVPHSWPNTRDRLGSANFFFFKWIVSRRLVPLHQRIHIPILFRKEA